MAVGSIITLSPSGKVLKRRPCWPWPKPGIYPVLFANGQYEQFFPYAYYHFTIGDTVFPFPPVPYTPGVKK